MAIKRDRIEETVSGVEKFLYREADLIDSREYDEWLTLLTEDIEYVIPVRETREAGAESEFTDSYHLKANHYRLKKRIERLQTGYAWAEDPPTRTRHMITNVRARPSDNDSEINVSSNLLLAVTRRDNPSPNIITGERDDVLRRVDGEWKLASRTIYLDQTTLEINLSLFV